ncbi:hypothetical protein Bca101_075447 [Brassica carinata]
MLSLRFFFTTSNLSRDNEEFCLFVFLASIKKMISFVRFDNFPLAYAILMCKVHPNQSGL